MTAGDAIWKILKNYTFCMYVVNDDEALTRFGNRGLLYDFVEIAPLNIKRKPLKEMIVISNMNSARKIINDLNKVFEWNDR